MKKTIAVTLLLSLLFTFMVTTAASSAEHVSTKSLFSCSDIYGKIFFGGKNTPVYKSEQLDTKITKVKILELSDAYVLEFYNDKDNYRIKFIPLEAKSNNKQNDHYVFSIISFDNERFECINISFTTCANKFDLMPVNMDLVNENVISILLKDKITSDVYYWQGSINGNVDKSLNTEPCKCQ